MADKQELHRRICREGMALMASKESYSQKEVLLKITHLGFPFKDTTFNNVLKGRHVGPKALKQAAHFVQRAVEKELGYFWKENGFIKLANEGFQSEKIPTGRVDSSLHGFQMHVERLKLSQKVDFFVDAKHEVIEFGVTLRKFTTNLCSGSKKEFREPIEKLLKGGVDFKCYLLNPNCGIALPYFTDRATALLDEADFAQNIKGNIIRLRQVQKEFAMTGYPGSFQVFTYQHIPYNYFMIVDPGKPYSRVMASHYMYGISRTDTPVIEFSKANCPILYQTYLRSFRGLSKSAKKIIPSNT